MNIFRGFSRKEIEGQLELKITLTRLQYLASAMKNNTDMHSDLKHWKENMTNLYDIELKNEPYLEFLKESYDTLYTLYLKKNHPELVTNNNL